MAKPILLSGIQPSGNLMIGNYAGALKNWVELQHEYDCIFILVDLHTITVRQDPDKLRQKCLEFLALYIACGLDPEKNTMFIQSHVPTHAEMTWVLNCYAYMGELNRMTQFKEKSQKHKKNINVGLFDYPVLMASDILLYQTDLVPVGEDQRQHLEFTRELARRFNGIYGETFKEPKAFIPKVGARIMSLQDPLRKMDKSDEDPRNYIALLDNPDIILKKFKSSVTDSGKEIVYREDKPGIANLMTIHSTFSGMSFKEIEKQYQGKGYGDFKKGVAEVVLEGLKPIQKRYHEVVDNKDYLNKILKRGATEALRRSWLTLDDVYKKIGFIPRVK
ncbi:tryptophan--tRNA ligase [Planctomycetota bacterium]